MANALAWIVWTLAVSLPAVLVGWGAWRDGKDTMGNMFDPRSDDYLPPPSTDHAP